MNSVLVFRAHDVISVVTNSSSELFVLKGETKNFVKEMVAEIYPNYLNEYDDVKAFKDLDTDAIATYLEYRFIYCGEDIWPRPNDLIKAQATVVPGFSVEDMFQVETHGGNNTYYYVKHDFVQKNKKKIVKVFDPHNEMYFMFSKFDNPDWAMQEKLEEVAERYHLG